MEKLNLAYLTVSSAKSYSFYMIPKELIDNPIFDSLGYGAKILYGLMLNRASLSAINPDFVDGKGNVYIIYTVEQVMADLRCSTKTAVKMFSQLENIGLIERHKHGQGKPATIYVKDFSTCEFEACKKYKSGSVKNTSQEVEKVQGSNTDISKNDFSNISIYPAQAEPEADNFKSAEAEPIDMIDTEKIKNPEITKDTIADKIGLSELISEHPEKESQINELYQTIVDVLTADNADKIRIAKKQIPALTVKQAFLNLNKSHLIYVMDCLNKNGGNIKTNAKGYILTALFNSLHSIGHYKPQNQTAFATGGKDKHIDNGYNIDNFISKHNDDC